MIVDTSAIISILREEEGHRQFIDALVNAETQSWISTATLLEVNVVLARAKDHVLLDQLDQLLADFSMEPVAFTMQQQKLAALAYREFGKGSGHKAKLNFGDCFAYSLAKERQLPLLFKGNDFRQTDIVAALS